MKIISTKNGAVMEFVGTNLLVKKYVFDFGDAIAEAVLYKYPDYATRTVICCSVQCGCPVGCVFCGTGKNFKRNLTTDEIVHQVKEVMLINDITDSKRLQIMFMSMGEPFLNFVNVQEAIKELYYAFDSYGHVDMFLSTIAPNSLLKHFNELIVLARDYSTLGLQFSIHSAFDNVRDCLIPFEKKLSLDQISVVASKWKKETGRKVRLNYCCSEDNVSDVDFQKLANIFDKGDCAFTFSVICSKKRCVLGKQRTDLTQLAVDKMESFGFDCHQFNPAGQDDIGGGCGQLHYVQDWFSNKKALGLI